MIAEAYNSICTCHDAFTGDILPCPAHGFEYFTKQQRIDRMGAIGSAAAARRAYAAAWAAGHAAGFEAALALMEAE